MANKPGVRELRTLAAEQVLVVRRAKIRIVLGRVVQRAAVVDRQRTRRPGQVLDFTGSGDAPNGLRRAKAKACFLSAKTSIFTDGERELTLLPSSGGVAPPYRLCGAPADAHVRNLITTESSLAYRFHQAALWQIKKRQQPSRARPDSPRKRVHLSSCDLFFFCARYISHGTEKSIRTDGPLRHFLESNYMPSRERSRAFQELNVDRS